MAGQLPSFLSGSNVIIRIGEANLAFCQDLRFSRSVGHIPVRGIGSYGTLALEPVDFSVNGSFVITRWFSSSTNKSIVGAPEGVSAMGANSPFLDRGNTLFTKNTFNPATMILSATFDIFVYPKNPATVNDQTATGVTVGKDILATNLGNYIYKIVDCRLTNYSFSFFPGQILNENTTFLGRTVINGSGNI